MNNIIRILGNKTAGFVLGMMGVLGLIAGSAVMNLNPKIYPPFFGFDLNFFFNPVHPIHSWLYFLMLIFFLYGTSLFFNTLNASLYFLRKKEIPLRSAGIIFLHFSVVLGLVGHLYEGFTEKTYHLKINEVNTSLPVYGSVWLEKMEEFRYPDNSLKDVNATLAFLLPDGSEVKKNISYNSPATFDLGRTEFVIQSAAAYPRKIIFTEESEKREYSIRREEPLETDEGTLYLEGVDRTKTGSILAFFSWAESSGESSLRMLNVKVDDPEGKNKIIIGKRILQFKEAIDAPEMVLLFKINPALPVTATAMLFFFIGLGAWFYPANRN